MAVVKWSLADPSDSTSYIFDVNPDPSSAGDVAFGRTFDMSAQTDLGLVLSAHQDSPLTATFEVTVLTKAQNDTLWGWYAKTDVLTLTDDLGRVSHIYFTELEAKRERSASNPWKHRFTAHYLVLSLTDI